MQQYRNERNGDVVTVPDALTKKYDARDHWTRVTASGKKSTAGKSTEEK